MMKKAVVTIGIISLALLSARAVGAETLSGYVKAARDSRPLQEASVVLEDLQGKNIATVSTDESGRYMVRDIEPGTYKITVFSPMRGERMAEKSMLVKQGQSAVKDFEVGPGRNLWGQLM